LVTKHLRIVVNGLPALESGSSSIIDANMVFDLSQQAQRAIARVGAVKELDSSKKAGKDGSVNQAPTEASNEEVEDEADEEDEDEGEASDNAVDVLEVKSDKADGLGPVGLPVGPEYTVHCASTYQHAFLTF
jgi:hypothetical protein